MLTKHGFSPYKIIWMVHVRAFRDHMIACFHNIIVHRFIKNGASSYDDENVLVVLLVLYYNVIWQVALQVLVSVQEAFINHTKQ